MKYFLTFVVALVCFVALSADMILSKQQNVVNLADYKSLQEAVDAVPEHGTLIVPAGVWKKGTAKLKSNMTLHLAKGAILCAPKELDDHIASKFCKHPGTGLIGHCVIYSEDAENITIEGEGTIDGRGYNFWPDYNGTNDYSYERDKKTGAVKYRTYKSVFPRPSLVIFYNVKNVIVRDITLRNPGAYTLWTVGCNDVRIDSINIKNIRRGPNSDGIDVDCCQNVWITNCNIETGDDAIAIKSEIRLLDEEQKPCENIHISGNTLSSFACGIRIGFEGNGVIRNISMTDNIIKVANIGIFLHSIHITSRMISGTPMENIIANNFIMNNVRMGLCVWHFPEFSTDMDKLRGYIRNVTFSNMHINACDYSFFGGKDVKDIQLDNIKMHIKRYPEAYKGERVLQFPEYPSIWGRGYLPEPITIYPGSGVSLENVSVTETK